MLTVSAVAIGASAARPGPVATPGAATPVGSPDASLGTRVADLEATTAAQTAALLALQLRVDALEQGLQPVLEGIPDQVAQIGSLQDQVNDLQARVSELEASPGATPIASPTDHPLIGTWAVSDTASGGTPGLLTFTPQGTVVVLTPSGASGIGAWVSSGPASAVAVWILLSAPLTGDYATAAIRAEITIDPAAQTITVTYQILGITTRGSVAEQNHGSLVGIRIASATP